MTDETWLTDRTWPTVLLRHLRGTPATRTKLGGRRLRLFACGCCRMIWPHIEDARLRDAVEVAERFADAEATAAEMSAAGAAANAALPYNPRGYTKDHPDARINTVVGLVVSATSEKPYEAAVGVTAYPLPLAGYRGGEGAGNSLICELLRDIFSTVFRPVDFAPAWRTDTAALLAKQMYEARDFSAMPILADALQDAGCDSDVILSHCRDPELTHVRGCWVTDLVLGRA
jgi:hypothetical protein